MTEEDFKLCDGCTNELVCFDTLRCSKALAPWLGSAQCRNATQYQDWMRIKGCLPEGVFVCPTDEGDMPVVHEPGRDVIVRHGDWIITDANGFVTVQNHDAQS